MIVRVLSVIYCPEENLVMIVVPNKLGESIFWTGVMEDLEGFESTLDRMGGYTKHGR